LIEGYVQARTPLSEFAKAFLAEIAAAEECQFASVGHGADLRSRSIDHQLSTISHLRLRPGPRNRNHPRRVFPA